MAWNKAQAKEFAKNWVSNPRSPVQLGDRLGA